jgi:hypothetical protein
MYHSLRQDGMQRVAAAAVWWQGPTGVWQLVYGGKALLPTATRPNLPTVEAKTEAADDICIDVLPAAADQVSNIYPPHLVDTYALALHTYTCSGPQHHADRRCRGSCSIAEPVTARSGVLTSCADVTLLLPAASCRTWNGT